MASMKIAFRVDANPKEGFNHLDRCLALAQGLSDTAPDCEILFISGNSSDYIKRISEAGFNNKDLGTMTWLEDDLDQSKAAIEEFAPDLVILDKNVDEKSILTLKKSAPSLAVIDDSMNLKKYDADIIINPNVHAHLLDYPCKSETILFLGTEYSILPKDFDPYQDFQRSNPDKAKRILITFEDGDPRSVSLDIVRAIKPIDDSFLATVVVGRDFQKGEELSQEIGLDPRFLVIQSMSDLPRRMASADLAITDTGNSFHGSIFFRLPAMLVNYRPKCAPITEFSSLNGLGVPLGEAGSINHRFVADSINKLINDQGERNRISGRMNELVDGLGRFRLADEILGILKNKG